METRKPKILLQMDTSRSCDRGILLGVARYNKTYQRWQISQKPPNYIYAHQQRTTKTDARDWLADAIIISTSEIPSEVIKAEIPVIGIDVRQKILKCPNIIGDNDAIAEMAAEYFMNRGFFNLAYCGFKNIDWSIKRNLSFQKILKSKHLKTQSFMIAERSSESLWDEQMFDLEQWLKSLEKPVAIFACNDDCGKSVIQACNSAGLEVPAEVAVLGVDNDKMVCLTGSTAMSSIAMNFKKAGFEAAELLDKIIAKKQKNFNDITLKPTHIITRTSTDVLAIEDKSLSKALSFIQKNHRQAIQVIDVVEAVGVSRRNLEYKFSKMFKRSINTQIRRTKVEHIAKMLIETDLPITQIALYFGFTDATHIARYFRKEKNISPLQFRSKARC